MGHDCPSCECDFSWSEEELARFRELRTEDSLAGRLVRSYEQMMLDQLNDPMALALRQFGGGPVTITVSDVGIVSGD